MSRVRRAISSLIPGHPQSDEGFSLIEVIVALGLLVAVMATTAGFFTTSLKQSNGQTQAQQAAVLADQQLDYTRGVPVGSLLSGRTQAAVAAAIASPPVGVDLSQDITSSGNYDTANPPASTAAVPISTTTAVGGTNYLVTTFIDQCYLTAASNSDCKSTVTTFGWVYRITVDVTYSLEGGRSCANNKPCYYVASTLRDGAKSEPCFNVQVENAGCSTLQPGITSISPNTMTTNSQTTVSLAGSNFDTGATVSLDSGGTVSNVNFISSSQLTFTLTTDNTSAAVGTRTVKVTNPNGKFAYGTVTIGQSAINVSSITPSSITSGSTATMTISGSGFQTGTQVTIPSAAGTIVGTPSVTSSSITLTFTAGSSSAATGTWPVTVTNPDGNSDSANVTVTGGTPHITDVSSGRVYRYNPVTVTITGTGFVTSGRYTPKVTVNGSTRNVSSVNVQSSTTVTFTYTSTAWRTSTYPVQVTFADGSVSDVYYWTP